MKRWTSHSLSTPNLSVEVILTPAIEDVVGVSIDFVRSNIPVNFAPYYRLQYRLSSVDTPSSYNGSYVYQHVLLESDGGKLYYDKTYKSSTLIPCQTLKNIEFELVNLDGSPCSPAPGNLLVVGYSIITLTR